MAEQAEKHLWERALRWCRSLAGVTVIATIVIALIVTFDRGGYVLVNTIVTGGMTALVAMGLALTLGVLNIPMFAHGEYFMIGSLTAYYVFTPIKAYIDTHPESMFVFWGPLITILAAMLVGAIAGVVSGSFMRLPPLRDDRERPRAARGDAATRPPRPILDLLRRCTARAPSSPAGTRA